MGKYAGKTPIGAIAIFSVAALAIVGLHRSPSRAYSAANPPTLFVSDRCSKAVTAYPATGNGDIAPLAPAPSGLSEPQFVAFDKNGNIYVTNSCTAAITIYAKGSNGDTPPIATIGGSNTGLSYPTGIALDSSGKIYVADRTADSVFVYPALGSSTGLLNEIPTATIGGSNTGLSYPAGIALDSSGKIYVADDGLDGYGPGSVFVYPALGGSTGLLNETPTATISGSTTGLTYPEGIALDSSSKIYVADEDAASVFVYPALGSSIGLLDETPTATISGSDTGLSSPFGIALDSSGNIYVADFFTARVNIFPAGSNADAAPIATISGSNTGLQRPAGIALDSKGDVYVVDDGPSGVGPDSVFAYPALGSSTGLLDEPPSAAITAAVTTGLKSPLGIALDSSGNIYVTDNGTASVFVYPAGSNANAAPIATISGINTGLSFPAGIALDSSGNIYVADYGAARVFVYPALGSSTGLLNETPTATISGINPRLTAPFGIALDSSGNIYVTDEFASIVFVYPALGSSTGMLNESPTAYISGSYTRLSTPIGITLDSSGKIYVADEEAASVFVYPALGSSAGQVDELPTAAISGTITGLMFPFGIALDSSDNIYVADYGVASVFVYPAGSNGDAAPSATISGPQAELGEPQFIAIETETGPTPTATATATSTRTGHGDCDADQDWHSYRNGNGNGHCNFNRHGDRDLNWIVDADGDCDVKRNADTYGYGNRHSDGNCDGHGDCDLNWIVDADGDCDVKRNADTYGYGDRHSDGDCNWIVDADGDCDVKRNADTYGYGNRHSDGNCDADRDCDLNWILDADRDCDLDWILDADRQCDRDCNGNGHCNFDRHGDRDLNRIVDADGDCDGNRNIDRDTNSDSHQDCHGNADSDSDSNSNCNGDAHSDRYHDRHVNSDGDCNAYAYCDRNGNADCHAYPSSGDAQDQTEGAQVSKDHGRSDEQTEDGEGVQSQGQEEASRAAGVDRDDFRSGGIHADQRLYRDSGGRRQMFDRGDLRPE